MISVLQFLTVVMLFSWPLYSLAAALMAIRQTGIPTISENSAPLDFWIIVPALNEAKVIANTVRAALSLEAPGRSVRVLVVDDGSDDETPAILAGITDPRLRVIRRDPPMARQGKGEALNAGYRAVRDIARAAGSTGRTIIGVIDGDGRGEPELLLKVGNAFGDPEVGATQCRVRINNRGPILGLLQDLEFACVTNASQALRDRVGSVGMGGNGQFVRLAELIRFGESPWSSCLVEDLELGLKLHLSGVVVRYVSVASMSQQAVVGVGALLRQRSRWAQGNMQCAHYARKLSGSRYVGSLGLLDFLYYLLAPWLTVPLTLVVSAAMGLAVYSLVTGHTIGGLMAGRTGAEAAIALWGGVLFLPGLMWGLVHRLGVGDEPLRRCLLAGLCYPGFLVLGGLATWRAVGRQLTSHKSWIKTERSEDAAAAEPMVAPPGPLHPPKEVSPVSPSNQVCGSAGLVPHRIREPQHKAPAVWLLGGTRPEAVKLAPLALALRDQRLIRPVVVSSGQHRTMFKQGLAAFDQEPDRTFWLRRRTGTQAELAALLTQKLDRELRKHPPSAVVVQGDTSTALLGALAAFWRRIPVVHLEAGLRSHDLGSPFPEEGNRKLIGQLAGVHLAPTPAAATNLVLEGIPLDRVKVIGNTVVDAVLSIYRRGTGTVPAKLERLQAALLADQRLVLVTVHRRESWGEPLRQVLGAVTDLLAAHPDVLVVLPVHPNPSVRNEVVAALGKHDRVLVTEPLDYPDLVWVLARSTLVLSDSGGIQEEAPSFGVPVLVLREVTERMEAVYAGCAVLVGTDRDLIVSRASRLLADEAARAKMTSSGNPFGDGRSADRAATAIAELLGFDVGAAPAWTPPNREPAVAAWSLPQPYPAAGA
jgi:UDP-N-acetylglucosamine 2-epimerase